MFSLIITIIAIALVAALALATIYFGGPASQKSTGQAKAARILNEGQQVKGAAALHLAETSTKANSMDGLISTKYLQSAPDGWQVTEGYTFRAESDYQVCLAANKKFGVNTVPACSDNAYASMPVCCTATGDIL